VARVVDQGWVAFVEVDEAGEALEVIMKFL
jgi:hypothetical protein